VALALGLWLAAGPASAAMVPSGPNCAADAGTKVAWCDDFTAESTGVPAGWSGKLNGGSAIESGGVLSLSAPAGDTQFPYLHRTTKVFPAAPFTAVWNAAYTSIGSSGDGVRLWQTLPADGSSEATVDSTAIGGGMWADTRSTATIMSWSGCGEPFAPAAAEAANTYSYQYNGDSVTVSVNGSVLFSCLPQALPTRFILGNPINPHAGADWSAFDLDYVRVEHGEAVPAPGAVTGPLKTIVPSTTTSCGWVMPAGGTLNGSTAPKASLSLQAPSTSAATVQVDWGDGSPAASYKLAAGKMKKITHTVLGGAGSSHTVQIGIVSGGCTEPLTPRFSVES
jgi:hypothetical protein